MTRPDLKSYACKTVSLAKLVKSVQSGFASGARDPNGVIQTRMNNVTTDGGFDWSSYLRVPVSQEKLDKYGLHKGDVLFNHTNSPKLVGKTAVFEGYEEPVVFSNHFVRLRVDEDRLNPLYLARWLNVQWQHGVFESLCTQWVNQAAVRRQDLLSLRIPLLPLPEQERIAGILRKANRLRRLRRYARELSDGYLQSVFLEMFGEYLADETHSQFADVLQRPLQNGVFEKNDKYGAGTPVIWVDNLYHTISIDTKNLRMARLDDKAIDKYEVIEGDLLFTRSSLVREGIGQINIVPKLSERTTFECHIIRARVNSKVVDPYYILGLYSSDFGKRVILKRSKTATMTTIGQDGIASLPCPVPPLPLQRKFANVVNKVERLRGQQQEAERQAGHLFQTLLHRAFRGEL